MLRTRVEKDFRITLPEELHALLQIVEEFLVTTDNAGQITLISAKRAEEILATTAGMWKNRKDVPSEGTRYVHQLRPAHRLRDLGIAPDDPD